MAKAGRDKRKPPSAAAKSPKNSHSSAAAIKRQERIKEAMEYRLIDYTYEEIGEQMGCDPTTALRYVEEGMLQIIQEPAEKVRDMELMRLRKLFAAYFPNAASQDLAALNAVLRIMERRSRYMGLDMPVKTASTDPEGNAVPVTSAAPPPVFIVFGGKPPEPPPPPPPVEKPEDKG